MSNSKATQTEGGEPFEKLRKLCDDKDFKEKVTGELQNIEEKYTLLKKNKRAEEMKMFNDSIHGPIELCLLLVKIIDTPQFQRLRHIKQLGAGYWVYPGAPHNRFEHSIGVAYLAGCLVSSLQEKQPELNITNRDKLCVQIAGLCHDLGHGPFSHLFDNMFIPEARPEKSEWKHEQGSVDMFNHMVDENDLREIMKYHGLNPDEDIQFITELIKGVHTSEEETTPDGVKTLKKWTATGRTEEKSFLYEILANKRNGIDVDKWDYFARDCHHLGISKSFDHQRLLKLTRVCDVEIVKDSNVMRKIICFRDKEKDNIYDMFCTRYNLHRQAYQHKTVNIIEIMIKDALLKADTHFKFSTMIDNMTKYTGLTDNVFERILYPDFDQQPQSENTRGELQEAQKIMKDIINRRLPKLVMEARLSDGKTITLDKLPSNWDKAWKEWIQTNGTPLKPDDFVFDLVKIDHGMKGKDLTENVYYYSKRDPNKAFTIAKDQMTSILPERFYGDLIRVYYKGPEDIFETAQECFELWRKKKFALQQLISPAEEPKHSFQEKEQKTNGEIKKSNPVELNITEVTHVTNKTSLKKIWESEGFKGFKDCDDFPLSWWSLKIKEENEEIEENENNVTEAERVHSERTQEQKPSFLNPISRYGNFKFTFPLTELMEEYKRQICDGEDPVFRVYQTKLYRKEIVYAMLIHKPQLNEMFKKYPELTGASSNLDSDKSGKVIWKAQATSKNDTKEEPSSHETKPASSNSQSSQISKYYVTDHVKLAFHLNEGKILQLSKIKLREGLTCCNHDLRINLSRGENCGNLKDAEKTVKKICVM